MLLIKVRCGDVSAPHRDQLSIIPDGRHYAVLSLVVVLMFQFVELDPCCISLLVALSCRSLGEAFTFLLAEQVQSEN